MDQNNLHSPCKQIMPLLGAYSIGATTPEETRAVEALLPTCPEAQAALAEHLAVGDALLYMLPTDKAPPPNLLDGLALPKRTPPAMHQIEVGETHEHLQAWKPAHHTNGVSLLPTAAPPAPAPAPAEPMRQARPWLAGAGLAAVLAVVVGMNVVWYQLYTQAQAQQATLTALVAQQQSLMAQMEQTASATTTSSLVVVDGEAAHLELTPNTELGQGANAQVVYDRASGLGSLTVNGLPPAPNGHRYQMWLVHDTAEVSLGTFQVSEGVGTLLFQSPVPINAADVFGISTEPTGGSPNPTTPHHLTGQVGT